MPSSSTFTSSSGPGKVRVYAAGDVHSRSPSVHSPTSSDSYSSSSLSEWTHVSEDDIDPSDSASRPSRQSRSRRHNTEARPAPTRRHSSRYVTVEQDEPPRPHRSHRHHSSRTHRPRDSHHETRDPRDSRRHPSDGSSTDTVELHDDYPGYGRHGVPAPHAPFPPHGAYRHGSGPIPHSHGGYPPGMPAPQGYNDPFQHPQALVHRGQHEPFGYPPQSNPFASGFSSGPPTAHPFSPMESASSASYFQNEGPPAPSMGHRPPGPSHRHSMYGPGPPSSGTYGSELMISPYSYPQMQPMPPGYPMPTHSPFAYPPSHGASPPPREEDKETEKMRKDLDEMRQLLKEKEEKKEEKKEEGKKEDAEKNNAMLKEMEALRAYIKQQDEERIKREQAIEAEKKAKKLKEEQEAQKAKEIAEASAAAKAAAEKAAEDAAKAAKEESDKKLAEAEAARVELEKKQKDLEEAVKKNEPVPDMLKKPIKFKDAVGRKFSFPWHLCKTWKGMEALIKQAFMHVDVIGQHVQEGHYDLMGPDGEIILPQVWDTMIQPDWEVSMHMWPIPETPEKKKKEKHPPPEVLVDEHGLPLADQFNGLNFHDLLNMDPNALPPPADGKAKKGKKADGKKAKRTSAHIVDVPPAAPAAPAGSPPGMSHSQALEAFLASQGQPPLVMDVAPGAAGPEAAPKKKPKKEPSPFARWMAGQAPRPSKKDDEKLEQSASNQSSITSSSHSSHHHAAVAPVAVPARRRRSTAGSSWTSASVSPPAKVVATADQSSAHGAHGFPPVRKRGSFVRSFNLFTSTSMGIYPRNSPLI